MIVDVDSEWFWWPIRVYYEDTDAGGIVYNANYLRFFERARTEWLRGAGIDHGELADAGLQLVLSRADIRFVAPARLDDELRAGVKVTRVRRASLDLEQRALHLDGQHLCTAFVQVACVATEGLRPRPFPLSLRESLGQSPQLP